MIFHSQMEKQVYFLEMKNRQVMLEKELKESQYQQLTQQIEPHFLFNALNSLLGLIRLKRMDQLQPAFEQMVRFLQYKYRSKQQLVYLSEETAHTRNYLAIQQLRFGSRLAIRWEIDPGLEDTLIPPYLLQTLVENAFKHGLEQTEEDPKLVIRIIRLEPLFHISVEDNGPGFSLDSDLNADSDGIGLKNIQRRLTLLFGETALMQTGQSSLGGAMVVLMFPLTSRKEREDERTLVG